MDIKPMDAAEAAEFCDNINLSDFNKIQSYGVLLALDQNLCVVQYSENVSSLLETPPHKLLNHLISHFLKPECAEDDLSSWLHESSNSYEKMLWQTDAKKIPVVVYLHKNSQEIILEIEPISETTSANNALLDLTQQVISTIKRATQHQSIQKSAQTTCEEIKKITGCHRVIIYKFNDRDQSGAVIAEALDNDMESYLGLHFPENDIPQPVREMYLKLPLRYIPTIFEPSIKIIPAINPITNNYLDLSSVNLRMIAPVHVKYLTNMKVASATSVAIIQNNKLWGLIACHHKEARFLSLNIRLALRLIANAVATQILALECTMDFRDEQKTVELQTTLNSNFSKALSFNHALNNYYAKLMRLVSATGMSLHFHGVLLNYGETPTYEQIIDLTKWLQKKQLTTIYASSTLPLEYEASISYKNKACGLLAIKVTAIENYYLLFYKPERIKTIAWGGNPSEPLKYSESSYSPRDSFERFLQTVKNQSAPWTNHEIRSANFIRSIVVNKLLQDLLETQVMHDPLTKLLNRLYLEQQLSFEIQRASREHKPIAIILADLDFFKKINDDFGHQAGDTFLVEFSNFMKNHFRYYDYIYRYGGEEFLILLPGIDCDSAKQKADLLRTETKKLKIQFNGSELPPVTISLGIAMYPGNGTDARSLIASADGALYRAKKNGRDQVVVAIAE